MQNDIFIKVEFLKPDKTKVISIFLCYICLQKACFISVTSPILPVRKRKGCRKLEVLNMVLDRESH